MKKDSKLEIIQLAYYINIICAITLSIIIINSGLSLLKLIILCFIITSNILSIYYSSKIKENFDKYYDIVTNNKDFKIRLLKIHGKHKLICPNCGEDSIYEISFIKAERYLNEKSRYNLIKVDGHFLTCVRCNKYKD